MNGSTVPEGHTGIPDELSRFLTNKGLYQPLLSPKIFFGMFATDTPIAQSPVLPHLNAGRVERLRLVHMDQVDRLVLRLWRSNFKIEENGTPLFVGTMEIQQRRTLGG